MREHKILSEDIENQIIDNYKNKKKGQLYCAKQAGISPYKVKQILIKHGIHIRTYSEAAIESNIQRRKYIVNENYFNTQSHNMAYLLGFFAADGSISKDSNEIKITLSSVDKDFLQSIADELECTSPVRIFTNSKGFECCSLKFSSRIIKDTFRQYGIVPNKTFTLNFPKNLDKKYWIDFIRGFFDGDGSVSTAGKNAIRWQLCCANKEPLETIVDFFYKEYNIPTVSILVRNPITKNGHPLYYCQYSTVSTRKIFDILYVDDSLYLPRKKDKFKSLI